jgi:rhodanese-related sulfurtransferase/rubrerythrin
MGLKELFTPTPSMDADEAKAFMAGRSHGSYTLLDVRQPGEYEVAHLPGSRLIPLPQLQDRLRELDPGKPTIVYCAVGGRSRVAAQILAGKGFKEVYNLAGGIKAWNGAKVPDVQRISFISSAKTPEELMALAYGMEEGLEIFYRSLAGSLEGESAQLLKRLASMEAAHKAKIAELNPRIKAVPEEQGSDASGPKDRIMEGGLTMKEILSKKEAILTGPEEILTAAMMLEAQAQDLYARASMESPDPTMKEALGQLADEEKAHLSVLGTVMEKRA